MKNVWKIINATEPKNWRILEIKKTPVNKIIGKYLKSLSGVLGKF